MPTNTNKTVEVMQTWCSGDFLYGAVRTGIYPAGIHHRDVNGREYPVAKLGVNSLGECKLIAWVPRSERFPEPIKGWN